MTASIFVDLEIFIVGKGQLHVLFSMCASQIFTMFIFIKSNNIQKDVSYISYKNF